MKKAMIEILQKMSPDELNGFIVDCKGLMCTQCGVYDPDILYDFFSDFPSCGTYMCHECLDKVLAIDLSNISKQSNGRLTLRFTVLMRDEFRCQYCGRSPKTDADVILEVDHIIPRSNGGLDTITNLVTACRECNQGKKDILLK